MEDVNYFRKTFHLRCLTGFWMCFESVLLWYILKYVLKICTFSIFSIHLCLFSVTVIRRFENRWNFDIDQTNVKIECKCFCKIKGVRDVFIVQIVWRLFLHVIYHFDKISRPQRLFPGSNIHVQDCGCNQSSFLNTSFLWASTP